MTTLAGVEDYLFAITQGLAFTARPPHSASDAARAIRGQVGGTRTLNVDNIGYYIMLALLVAAAGYSVAGRGKPKPAPSRGRRKIALICFGIALVCGLLVAMLALLPAPTPH